MLIALETFAGELPRFESHLLPPPGAQAALDVDVTNGSLRSAKGLSGLLVNSSVPPNGAWFADDGNVFVWSGVKTVAKSPVINDFYQRVYYVDQGSRWLYVFQQIDAIRGIEGWDATTTYPAGFNVTLQKQSYLPWATTTIYGRGQFVIYDPDPTPPVRNLLWRSEVDNNVGHTPALGSPVWSQWGEGIKYKSLQAGNVNHFPETSPDWWVRDSWSLNGWGWRAGIPAPAFYTAKVFGTGAYNLNVLLDDPEAKTSFYAVPQSIADIRAETDGSSTGIANTNALVAVARASPIDNLVFRANADADTPNDTANSYYAKDGLKYEEHVVQLHAITHGRLYTFTPYQKNQGLGRYTVSALWRHADGTYPAIISAQYFNLYPGETLDIEVTGPDVVSVLSASNMTAWNATTGGGTGLVLPYLNYDYVQAMTMNEDGLLITTAEVNTTQLAVYGASAALMMRAYDLATNAVQFEVDSQDSSLNDSNANLLYRGLRLVLRDLRLGEVQIGGWVSGVGYNNSQRVEYTRGAYTATYSSLKDNNLETPLPPDWNIGTTYGRNDLVYVPAGAPTLPGITYRSMLAGNVGHNPSDPPPNPYWLVNYSDAWTADQFTAELSYGTAKTSYVFTYTLVNPWGEEGPPADPVSIEADFGQTVTLHGFIDPTDDHYNGYYKGVLGWWLRYYGFAADSTGGGEYRMLFESGPIGPGSGVVRFGYRIIDTPADWQEPLQTVTWDPPPANPPLPGLGSERIAPKAIAAGPNGMLALLYDASLCISEPYRGWAYPKIYRKALPFKGVGLMSVPGGWLVTTVATPYFFAGPIPEQISRADLPLEQAGLSQISMCSMGQDGSAYASNDGIVVVKGLGSSLATTALFTRQEWRNRYGPLLPKLRLAFHDGRLIGLFPGISDSESFDYQGFVIRFDVGAPTYNRISLTGRGMAIDQFNDRLLIGKTITPGSAWGWYGFEEGLNLPLTWQSKEFILPSPANMGAAMIDYVGGPWLIDVHADGVTIDTTIVPWAGNRIEAKYRVPTGLKTQRYSIYLTEYLPQDWLNTRAYAVGDSATWQLRTWVAYVANTGMQPDLHPELWVLVGGGTINRYLLATSMSELNRK